MDAGTDGTQLMEMTSNLVRQLTNTIQKICSSVQLFELKMNWSPKGLKLQLACSLCSFNNYFGKSFIFYILKVTKNKRAHNKRLPPTYRSSAGAGGSYTFRLLRLTTMPLFFMVALKQLSLQMIQEDLFWKLWIFSFHAFSCILDLVVALNLPC